MKPNNIIRLLDSKGIPHQVFETSNEKLGAEETAAILGIPKEKVFKTIVVQREHPGKPILAIVSGSQTVDLKKLAAFLNEKKLHLPSEREAETLTGLQAGGISPLALIQKGFQIVIDSSALDYETIHISGGQRGMNIQLKTRDLIGLTRAVTAKITSH